MTKEQPYMDKPIQDNEFEKWWATQGPRSAAGNESVNKMMKSAALRAWIASKKLNVGKSVSTV